MNTLNIKESPDDEITELPEANNAPIYSLDEGFRVARILQYPMMLKHPTITDNIQSFIVYHETEFIEYLNNSPISQSTPLLLEPLITDEINECNLDLSKKKEIIKQHCREIAIAIAKLD